MRTANALRGSGFLRLSAGCFSEANVARQLTAQGREETIDLPPDSRPPSSPTAAASDHPERGAG